ncbi:hypothetical protein LQ953_03025 [Sphingomonas sp. IC-56]|uniref:hypothetical protein n=1 Tax=Sphingomonas sp. IC-56 TaxID=2898529 RepID=UPI001E40A5A5|nr:hypothetical protein [Sphingomonas sp. IC-56]MCD2322987.1 hypothetical protein [Sphingomonas sp. IC-56]
MSKHVVDVTPDLGSTIRSLPIDDYVIFQAFFDAVVQVGHDVIGGPGVPAHSRITVEWSDPAEISDLAWAIFWLQLQRISLRLRLEVKPEMLLLSLA